MIIKIPRHRIVLGLIIIGIITVLSAIVIKNNYDVTKKRILSSELDHLLLIVQSVDVRFKEMFTTLHTIAHEGEFRKFINNNSTEELAELTEELIIFSRELNSYDQIRYIDEKGNERLRINHNSGNPVSVRKKNLQNKFNRYYFAETMKLDFDEVYISPIDLNMVQGEIEKPYKPMIRVATPVFNHAGDRKGIIILNYIAKNLLTPDKSYAKHFVGQISTVNPDGFFLRAANPEDEWGFMIPEKVNRKFSVRHPDVWNEISAHDFGEYDDEDALFVYRRIYPAERSSAQHINGDSEEYHWIIISEISDDIIFTSVMELAEDIILIDVILGFLLFIAAYFYQKNQTEKEKHAGELIRQREKIFEANEKFKTLTENSLVGVYLITDDIFQYVNPKFCEIIGYESDEVSGKMSPQDIVFEDDGEQVRENHRRRIAGEVDSVVQQFRCIRKSGELIKVEVYGTRLESEGTVSILGTMIDVTEKENLLAELRKSEEKYRNVVENSPEMIAIHCKGKLVYVNPAVQKMMGIEDRGKLYGKSVLEFVHPDYRQIAIERMTAVQQKGNPAGIIREKFVKVDGTPFDVEVNAIPFTWEGEPAVQVLIRDITAQLKAEAELTESLEQFKTLAEKAPVAISILTAEEEYKFEYVNPAWVALFGYRLEEIQELDPFSILNPESMSRLSENRNQIMEDRKEHEVNLIQALTKEGKEIWLKVSSHEIMYMGRRAIISSGVDVTQTKKYESELVQAQEKLEETVRIRTEELERAKNNLEKSNYELTVKNDKLKEMNDTLVSSIKSFSERENRIKELRDENTKLKDEISRLIGE